VHIEQLCVRLNWENSETGNDNNEMRKVVYFSSLSDIPKVDGLGRKKCSHHVHDNNIFRETMINNSYTSMVTVRV